MIIKKTQLKTAIFIILLIFIIIIGFNWKRCLPLPSPNLTLSFSPWICPTAIYGFKTYQNLVALTIDDAPNNETTELILDTLERHKAKATFFLIGHYVTQVESQIKDKSPIIKRMIKSSHEIGNHLTQDQLSLDLNNEQFTLDLQKAKAILDPYNQQTWLRPGGGFCRVEMVKIAQENNYKTVLGTIWPYDTLISDPDYAANFIEKSIHSGAIIILHDGKKRGKNTIKTLDKLFNHPDQYPNFHQYQLVTLSELAQQGQPMINSTQLPTLLENIRQFFIQQFR